MPKGVYPRTLSQRRASSRRMRQRWRDPETRAAWSAASSARLTKRNADPAFKAAIQAKVAAGNRDPAKKARVLATRKKNFHVPPPLAKFYRKLRIAFGAKRAREELRRVMLENAKGGRL